VISGDLTRKRMESRRLISRIRSMVKPVLLFSAQAVYHVRFSTSRANDDHHDEKKSKVLVKDGVRHRGQTGLFRCK
jgi:hypothetical protein